MGVSCGRSCFNRHKLLVAVTVVGERLRNIRRGGMAFAAIEMDDLQLLILNLQNERMSEEMAIYAASRGDRKILDYLYDHGCHWSPLVMQILVLRGAPVAEVRCYRESGFTWDPTTFTAAAIRADLDLLEYLQAAGCIKTADTAVAAAETPIVLSWLLAHSCPTSSQVYLAAVDCRESLDMLWRIKCPLPSMAEVVRTGSEHGVLYFHNVLQIPFDPECYEAACREERLLPMLKLLTRLKSPFCPKGTEVATLGNNLPGLRYLRENLDYSWYKDSAITTRVAGNGWIPMFEYLREHGAPCCLFDCYAEASVLDRKFIESHITHGLSPLCFNIRLDDDAVDDLTAIDIYTDML